MVRVLADAGAYPPMPQPEEGVTYAAKIAKEETRLDFSRDAAMVERQIRAFNPPGAWFEVNGERVRILSATVEKIPQDQPGTVVDSHPTIACATDAICPVLMQRAGRGVMTAEELMRGFPILVGTML